MTSRIMMSDKQKTESGKLAVEGEGKAETRKLLVLTIFWAVVFVAAVILIVNVFRPQWTTIANNVRALIGQKPKTVVEKVETEVATAGEVPTPVPEASESGKMIDVEFIEGLVEAILTASESAQVATSDAAVANGEILVPTN